MKIPFLDLKKQYLQIKNEILREIECVLEEAIFSSGKYVEKFEINFASFCGTKYCVAVNNGTSALHLTMLALGIGKGDEVIVPANTFIATAWSVSYCNATPVFVDCTADTWEIDASKIEEKITHKTKAIAGVHLYGQPFDVDPIQTIAKKYKLYLIEDAAQAHGALYKGQRVGSFGEMACFSFYPSKNLGTYGEGGAIVTNHETYYNHLNILRNNGSRKRYYHDEIGFNMRMGEIEAAVLCVKLQYLNLWNYRRKEIARMYQQGISNPKIKLQSQPSFTDSVYHLFVITTKDRNRLMKYLQANGVFTGLHYPIPCHLQKAYAHLGYKKGDFPNAEYLAAHCLSLPMFPELTNEEVEKIIELLNKF